jgi:triphosphoribosyl-dephospho-CoA synthetase
MGASDLLSRAPDAFLRACRLDVEAAKPGNVSIASAGHGMQAAQFIDSAEAAAPALFARGARVGERILDAVTRTRHVAGCNTNLGIVLLVAPLAAALESVGDTAPLDAARWQASVETVLSRLDVDDARAAYRAIALANPGGLGDAPEQSPNATASHVNTRTASRTSSAWASMRSRNRTAACRPTSRSTCFSPSSARGPTRTYCASMARPWRKVSRAKRVNAIRNGATRTVASAPRHSMHGTPN